MEIGYKTVHELAKCPDAAYQDSNGYDLYSIEDVILKSDEIKKVRTGICLEIPDGHAGFIWAKSGLSNKGIFRLAGLIDQNFTGEIEVVLINFSKEDFEVKVGTKIAQIVFQKTEKCFFIKKENLNETTRGDKGWGSSGK